MRAEWNGTTIAESDDTVIVEGNHYFPAEDVNSEYLEKSGNTYYCPWKGTCDYYNVVTNGDKNEDAAWMYPDTKVEARHIEGRFAFWNGVQVTE